MEIPIPSREPLKNAKAKTSLNLQGIFKPTNAPSSTAKTDEVKSKVLREAVKPEQLKEVWNEFAEKRKNQTGEYHLLTREIDFQHPVILITLSNEVEETLLENFKRELTGYIRERLRNNDLTISTRLKLSEGKKMIYTPMEKFDHLTEKNPYLKELRDRFGIDWDS